jgi:hypothetical protein
VYDVYLSACDAGVPSSFACFNLITFAVAWGTAISIWRQKCLAVRYYQQSAAFRVQIHEVRYDKQNAYQSVAKVMDLKVG